MSRLSDALLQHLRDPQRAGEPAGGHDLRGEARHPACRDHLVLYLALDGARVADAGFRATGCPACLAMASAAAGLLPGEALDPGLPERLRDRFHEAYGEPGPLHRHALALVLTALRDLEPAEG